MNEPPVAVGIRRSRTPPAARVVVAATLALLAAVAPRPAWAAGCGGGTQAELDGCAEARRVAADARLNEAYARVAARLGGAEDQRQRDAFRDAERAWIGFRDAECRFEGAPSYGGSMHSMELAECAARLSDARAATLSGMANCHARDGSCVLGP